MNGSDRINAIYRDYLDNGAENLEPLILEVHKIGFRYFRDEDTTQEFVLRFIERLPSLEISASSSFAGYLHRRLVWFRLDWHRRQTIQREREQQAPVMFDDDNGELLTDEESLDILQFRYMQKQGRGPQHDFGSIADPLLRRAAGLLAYGYDIAKVAERLSTTEAALRKRIQRHHKNNFK